MPPPTLNSEEPLYAPDFERRLASRPGVSLRTRSNKSVPCSFLAIPTKCRFLSQNGYAFYIFRGGNIKNRDIKD